MRPFSCRIRKRDEELLHASSFMPNCFMPRPFHADERPKNEKDDERPKHADERPKR
jgi:hypothetical protein